MKNRIKRALAGLLMLMLVVTQIPTGVFAADVTGSGTKSDPYIVTTGSELKTYLNKGYVKLDADIESTNYFFTYESEIDKVAKEFGIDLNGHILKYTGSDTMTGRYINVEHGRSFTISDSNPTSEHGSEYTTSDGTPIKGGIITGYRYKDRAAGFNSCIYVWDAEFTMTGGTFYNNNTNEGGTCIGIRSGSTVNIYNVNFYDNTSQYFGTCIWADDNSSNPSTLTVTNCNFIGNSGEYSSTIDTEISKAVVKNCIIKNNTVDVCSAVRVSKGGSLELYNTEITGNKTKNFDTSYGTQAGGVIVNLEEGSSLTLNGKVTITGNTVNGVTRNLYSASAVNLGSSFSSDSQIGVYRKDSYSKGDDYKIVNDIKTFKDCFTSDVEGVPVHEKGSDLYLGKALDGAGIIGKKNSNKLSINNDVSKMNTGFLTEEEKLAIKNGWDAVITPVVREDVSKNDLTKVNAKLGSYKLGKAYDILLTLKVDNLNTRTVTETTDQLSLSLKVPDELVNTDSKVKRTYKIMRVHDGEVSILDGTYDESSQTFTFETNKFSTYALIYSDATITNGNANNTQNDTKTNTTTQTTAQTQGKKAPKTSDNNPAIWMLVLLMAGGAGITVLGFRRKMNK